MFKQLQLLSSRKQIRVFNARLTGYKAKITRELLVCSTKSNAKFQIDI